MGGRVEQKRGWGDCGGRRAGPGSITGDANPMYSQTRALTVMKKLRTREAKRDQVPDQDGDSGRTRL